MSAKRGRAWARSRAASGVGYPAAGRVSGNGMRSPGIAQGVGGPRRGGIAYVEVLSYLGWSFRPGTNLCMSTTASAPDRRRS